MTLLEAKKHRMSYGLHVGQSLDEIAAADPSYLGWLATVTWLDADMLEAVRLVCESAGIPVKTKQAAADDRQGQLFTT